jgi:hypothetical protein
VRSTYRPNDADQATDDGTSEGVELFAHAQRFNTRSQARRAGERLTAV